MLNFRLISLWVCLVVLLPACQRKQALHEAGGNVRIDSMLFACRDSMISHPSIVRANLKSWQQQTADSINYYKLGIFVGFCYYHELKDDSAHFAYREVMDYINRQQESNFRLQELKANVYNYMSIMMQESGWRDSAIVLLTNAYQALLRSENKSKMPDICINMADNYYQSGNYVGAVSWYRQALRYTDSLKVGSVLNHAIYCGMGRLYCDIGNERQADYYYKLAEESFDRLTPYEQFYFANTRGNFFYLIKRYPEALPWFYKANRISRQFNKALYRAITESNLGEVYLLMGQTDSAQFYLDKAATVFLDDFPDVSMQFYFDGLYASLALCRNDLKQAQELLAKPYDDTKISPNYLYLRDQRLEELYARMGDYSRAYYYGTKRHQYDDSLRNVKTLNNIAEIDFRYKQDTLLLRRDVQLAQNQADTLKLSYLSVVLALSLVLILVALVLVIIYARRRREQSYARQMATITQLRMENVRNRVSPHFIFNALNAFIPALRKYEQLDTPLRLLIQSIRNNLAISDKLAIPLEKEIAFVRDFLELKRSIDTVFPQVEWDIDENVEQTTLIPSMAVQILVENAVKYAFRDKNTDEADRLTISIRQTHTDLNICVEDNGVGCSPTRYADVGKGTGTGLKVLLRTAELLNRKNMRKLSFRIENLAEVNPSLHGTRASCQIPLHYNYNV